MWSSGGREPFFICCVNIEKKSSGDGILNILPNHCTDKQNVFLLVGEERVFLRETSQAQKAKLFCAHQMTTDEHAHVSDSSRAKYVLS